MTGPHIYLEVKPRTLEDELNLLADFDTVSREHAFFAAGARVALEWLLQGKKTPSSVLAEVPLQESLRSTH